MKKKILSFLLALTIVLVLLPPKAMAEESTEDLMGEPFAVTGGNIYYSFYDSGDIWITACDPGVTEAIIPSSINGVPVVGIGMAAFDQCTKLINVSIPNSVTQIGTGAFYGCTSLASIEIPDSVNFIGSWAFCECSKLKSITLPDNTDFGESTFVGCTSLEFFSVSKNHKYLSTVDGVLFDKEGTVLLYYPAGNLKKTYTIPDGVTYFGASGGLGGAFTDCNNLTSIIVPDSVTEIGMYAFFNAKGLTSVTLPDSITRIGEQALSGCDHLKDIYYAGSEAKWKQINIEGENESITSATIHYNSTFLSTNTENSGEEYIYNTSDFGEGVKLPTELLDKISDSTSVVNAVRQMTSSMTREQKSSPTGIDLATLYAETAISKAASKTVDGDVIISAASVADVEAAAAQAASAVETALVNGGITTARYLSNTVTLTTDETSEITIKIDPDILTTKVDKICVETPGYALTLKTADLAEDLTEILTITAEEIGSGFAPGKANRKVTVKLTLPKGKTTNPVTVSLPANTGSTTYQAVVKTDGSATSSKYNPATTTMDGKVNTSGTYTVKTNEKSFTDISNKSAEMQKAILYLTSKGIINGTSATTFSPNGTINRQQVAALLMRALGKVDNSATVSFKDVSASSSLYHEIASSKKHKIINGYSDNTFRGTNVISKAQIVTVAGRVLVSEMNYKTPANTNSYLGKYSDAVPDFAKEMTALATRENLVVYRTDGTFSGNKNMTRGDAAIILYRLFQKIW